MKKLFVVLLAAVSIGGLHSQGTKKPAALTKAFPAKFPNAKEVKWDKESKNEYEASFVQDGKKGSANFSTAGEWLETEMAIPQNAAPKAVIDGFNKAYAGAAITEVYKIESKTGKNYFEIEYTIKGKKKEAKLSSEGKSM